VTGNDITWPHVTESDPEVTWFDRKSPGSGCTRPKTPVYCTLHFLQGCSSQEEAVTEVTRKWCHLIGSYLEVAVEDQKLIHSTFHFLQVGLLQEEAVTRESITSRDLRWLEVTLKWRHLTGSHLEEAVKGQKLVYTVNLTSYKAVARRRRQLRYRKDVTWPQVTGSDPEVMSFALKNPGSVCRRPKVMYTVHFTSYKSVAHRRRQSHDRKWHHEISGNRKWPWSDVVWPEVTWKWL